MTKGAGSLVSDVLFEGNQWQSQLSRLSGATASAVSGVYEDRYNGGFCQYFISTRDHQLVELSKEFTNDDTALRDILERELETLRFESRSYSGTFESALYEFERSSVLLAEALQSAATDGDDMTGDPRLEQALQEQVDLANQQGANLSTLMDLNQNRIELVERRLRAPETIETTILAVNNPCREFAIGQSIMVSAIPNFNEFAIQPLAQGIRTHLE